MDASRPSGNWKKLQSILKSNKNQDPASTSAAPKNVLKRKRPRETVVPRTPQQHQQQTPRKKPRLSTKMSESRDSTAANSITQVEASADLVKTRITGSSKANCGLDPE